MKATKAKQKLGKLKAEMISDFARSVFGFPVSAASLRSLRSLRFTMLVFISSWRLGGLASLR